MKVETSETEDIELFPESFFDNRSVEDVVDEYVNDKQLIYAKMTDGVIVPFFRVMNRNNSV